MTKELTEEITMEELITLRPHLVSKRDALSVLIENIDTVLGTAPCDTGKVLACVARPAAPKPKQLPAKPGKPAKPAKASAQKAAPKDKRKLDGTFYGRAKSPSLIALEEIIDGYTAEFTTAKATADLKEKLGPDAILSDGFVVNALFRWQQKTWISRTKGGGGPGHPATYAKTKNWGYIPGESSKQADYRAFRGSLGVKPPLAAEDLV